MARSGIGFLAAAIILMLDQLTKHMVLVQLGEPVSVTSFLNLVLVWNRGVSFGMLGGLGAYAPWLLVGFALAISLALMIWLTREVRLVTRIALGLVLGGAIGNAIDRIRFGAVVDFLDFHALGYHWPAFNVADSAIVVGAALLVLEGLRGSGPVADEARGHSS
jgi:signal peptidase II